MQDSCDLPSLEGKSSKRRNRHVLAALVGAGVLLGPTLAFADEDDGPRCGQVTFPVSLSPGQPADNTIVAWLCARGPIAGRTIQVLLHGGTYDHNYWDFPLQPEHYSYVRALTNAGYVTLNLDRLGSGLSSHPNPDILTLHANAFTVHQIVQAFRTDGVNVPGFGLVQSSRIELVGHSLGSYISAIEASTYDDVDGVILSAYSHTVGPGTAVLVSDVYPAAFDPKFASLGLPFDYLTTMPGTRGQAFYFLPGADPDVIAEDEQLKQTVAVGELTDLDSSFPESLGIHVPTLVADGDFDSIDCNAPSCSQGGTLATEASNFSPDACVQIADIPRSGHDLNLHRDAPAWFGLALAWSDLRVGRFANLPPIARCPRAGR
jgi:pimeloyl-ACP methyl ester carboxylesterase